MAEFRGVFKSISEMSPDWVVCPEGKWRLKAFHGCGRGVGERHINKKCIHKPQMLCTVKAKRHLVEGLKNDSNVLILSLRVLIGAVENGSAADVSQLVNTTGVDLVLSDLLSSKNGGRLLCPVCLTVLGCA